MAERDYDSFLAALRLHREQIEEAMLVIERLVKTEKSSDKSPAWAKVVADSDEEDDHITYKEMLRTLQENRSHAEEAILAIERLARGREGLAPPATKRAKPEAKPPSTGKKRSAKK